MEIVLTQFWADRLDMKLTSERLFFTTPYFKNAIALGAIKGIYVVNLTDKYLEAVEVWKSKRKINQFFLFLGIFFFLVAFWVLFVLEVLGFFVIGFSFIFLIPSAFNLKELKANPPVVLSVIRLKIGSRNMDFPLAPGSYSRDNLADFIIQVERSLSRIHKTTNNSCRC